MARVSSHSLLAERSANRGGVPCAELVGWRERFGLLAGITERGTGDGFSLGLSSAEPVGVVVERWRTLRRAVRAEFPAVQRAHQVHGVTVLWHEHVAQGWHEADDADAHATSLRGLLLTVTVADCVPVYLTTTGGAAVALLHAGWRGTAAGILEAGVRRLCERSKASPDDLVMHCGVAICASCYEVGEEVALAVLGDAARPGKQHLDLRLELAGRATALGVGEVSVSPLCTSCDRDRFFSHRATGGGGRMAAYLGIPLRP